MAPLQDVFTPFLPILTANNDLPDPLSYSTTLGLNTIYNNSMLTLSYL